MSAAILHRAIAVKAFSAPRALQDCAADQIFSPVICNTARAAELCRPGRWGSFGRVTYWLYTLGWTFLFAAWLGDTATCAPCVAALATTLEQWHSLPARLQQRLQLPAGNACGGPVQASLWWLAFPQNMEPHRNPRIPASLLRHLLLRRVVCQGLGTPLGRANWGWERPGSLVFPPQRGSRPPAPERLATPRPTQRSALP